MSHCDNCQHIDRLERQRGIEYDKRREAEGILSLLTKWASGKGIGRFFVSYANRTSMWDGAMLVIKNAEKRIEELDADIEKVEKATVEGEVRVAARKMAKAVEKSLFAPQTPADRVKGLAEALDADLSFEDKVADLKLTDLVETKEDLPEVQLACTCKVGDGPNKFHDFECATVDKTKLMRGIGTSPGGLFESWAKNDPFQYYRKDRIPASAEQDHSVHQGTHYEGDACKPAHPVSSAEPVSRTDLISLYAALRTDELKVHVEAALDAAVARGVSLTVGELAAKGYETHVVGDSCSGCSRPLKCHCGIRYDEPGHGTKACLDPAAPKLRRKTPSKKRK